MRRYSFALIFTVISAAYGQSMVAVGGLMAANQAITGAPYSAEQVSEHVQTLADGSHITRSNPVVKFWRDSNGRVRTERAMGMALPGDSSSVPTMVEISDPVAQVRYTLDPGSKIAHRQKLGLPMPAHAMGGGGGSVRAMAVLSATPLIGTIASPLPNGVRMAQRVGQIARPEISTEQLGVKTIEGVQASGTRVTQTWAVGAVGNDGPLSVVNETWMATELKVPVLEISNDPRSGESTTRLRNVSQGEPPAALFEPPADYAIEDGNSSIR
jgi:hypothetical protein